MTCLMTTVSSANPKEPIINTVKRNPRMYGSSKTPMSEKATKAPNIKISP